MFFFLLFTFPSFKCHDLLGEDFEHSHQLTDDQVAGIPRNRAPIHDWIQVVALYYYTLGCKVTGIWCTSEVSRLYANTFLSFNFCCIHLFYLCFSQGYCSLNIITYFWLEQIDLVRVCSLYSAYLEFRALVFSAREFLASPNSRSNFPASWYLRTLAYFQTLEVWISTQIFTFIYLSIYWTTSHWYLSLMLSTASCTNMPIQLTIEHLTPMIIIPSQYTHREQILQWC